MGWLSSGLTYPVSCLILVWAAGSGSIRVLHEPVCYTDYHNTSVCEWTMDTPTNCSAELLLSYKSWIEFDDEATGQCVPKNQDSMLCTCMIPMTGLVRGDYFLLNLSTGEQFLWNGTFRPSDGVKPMAPVNLRVENVSSEWVLRWSGLYTEYLTDFQYLVSIVNVHDSKDFKEFNVTYKGDFLKIPAKTLRSEAFYRARVKALAQGYKGFWSDWSTSVQWQNDIQEQPWEQHMELGVALSCVVILVICVSCYCSVSKLKREWWDQIPNPARSPLMAIIIQDSQVTLWKHPRVQEAAKIPHWKTCIQKLLPCLLEHPKDKTEDALPKAAGGAAWRGAGGPAWQPLEISKTVLRPESICVERCVELQEVPGLCKPEEEEEEEEEEEGMEEEEEEKERSLCLGSEHVGGALPDSREGIAARLAEDMFLDLLGAGNDDPLAPSGPRRPETPDPQEARWQDPGQRPSEPELQPCDTECQHPAVVTDNPAYRSFSQLLGQEPQLTSDSEEAQDLQEKEEEEEEDRNSNLQPQLQPEPETWEQLLRLRVLQHQGAPVPSGTALGYRHVGGTGYKALSSLLTPGAQDGAGGGGYRPFQSAPEPTPLFTFGLDPPKPPPPSKAAPEPGEDLGAGVVYSALTCHLCGHLKQRHPDDAPVPGPCCGCCCGDQAPLSPLGGSLPKAPTSVPLLGAPQEGKPALSWSQTAMAGPPSTCVS